MAERLPVGRGEESGREQQQQPQRRRASVDVGGRPHDPPAACALRRCQSDPQLLSRCPSGAPAGGVLRGGGAEKEGRAECSGLLWAQSASRPFPPSRSGLAVEEGGGRVYHSFSFARRDKDFLARVSRSLGEELERQRQATDSVKCEERGAPDVRQQHDNTVLRRLGRLFDPRPLFSQAGRAVVLIRNFLVDYISSDVDAMDDFIQNLPSNEESASARLGRALSRIGDCTEIPFPFKQVQDASYHFGERLERQRDSKGSFQISIVSGADDELIHRGERELIRILEKNLEDILDALFYRSVIASKEYNDLKKMKGGSKQTSQRLLVMIQERGQETCSQFLECVEMTCPDSIHILGQAAQGKSPDHVSEPMMLAQSSALIYVKESKERKTKMSTTPGEWTRCNLCHSENLPETIEPDMVWDSQRRSKIYRLCCTEPGTFRCCYTDLIFEVREAVNITYHCDSWQKHLSAMDAQNLMVAGPLLNIHAEPVEAVAAVLFPHFLCLADRDRSQVQIAHFVDGNMSLEIPDSVEPFHVTLRNPRFSPRGVVSKNPWWKRKKKVHAMVMLYEVLSNSVSKFHFYLLPNESTIRKSVHDHEVECGSRRLEKPSWTLKPLTIGFHYFLLQLDGVVINPEELEFTYADADMEQQYLELYAKKVQDTLELRVIEKNKDEIVWTAYVRQDELLSPSSCAVQEIKPSGHSGLHFIERHRAELIQRTCSVEKILDTLVNVVINFECYDKISSRNTNQDKMRELYKLVPSWDEKCKDVLYLTLKATNKFLIAELEQKDRLRNQTV